MDSLPEQHIDSLPNSSREEAYRQIGTVCAFRMQGLSEEEVAKKAGFSSVGDMYFRLKRWGLSGLLPLKEESEKAPKSVRERKARGSGTVVELPSADAAAPLFREKLEMLIRGTEELKHRKEKLQGKRFVQSSVYTAPVHFFREAMSDDEQWQSLSEHCGFEPDADRFSTSDVRTWSLGGGTSTPQAPLPALIAAYVLMQGELEPLLEALYPGTPAADVLTKIRRRVEGKKGSDKQDGLKALVRQLATLVRGGDVDKGRDPAELSRHEINLACRITDDREAGILDEEIYEKLRHNLRLEEELPWDEFSRLRDLNLRWPFRQ